MVPPKGSGMQALAAMTSHVPNKGEQMMCYYGYYSNASRGRRKKVGIDAIIPCPTPSAGEKCGWSRLVKIRM